MIARLDNPDHRSFLVNRPPMQPETSAARPTAKRTVISLAAFLATLLPWLIAGPGLAEEVALMLSGRQQPYEGAAKGAREALSERSVLQLQVTSDLSRWRVRNRLKRAGVTGILAFGRLATVLADDLEAGLPIVYCMVLDPSSVPAGMAGVSLQIPFGLRLQKLRLLLPKVKKVAIIHDPARNTRTISRAAAAAERANLQILPLAVSSVPEVSKALRSIQEGGGDALLMIPDPTVYNGKTMRYVLRYTIEHRIPFMATDRRLVEDGALCAVSPEFSDIGAQAASLLERALTRGTSGGIPSESPRRFKFYLNVKTSALIGIKPSDAALSEATSVGN